MKIEHKDEIKKIIKKLGVTRGEQQAFIDVVTCVAYSIANAVDYKQVREDEYLRIINKYPKEEIQLFTQVLPHLVEGYSDLNYGDDILGTIYEELNLNSRSNSQFFTPTSLSKIMAKVTITEEEAKNVVKDKGYISLNDDACGSGRLLYAGYESLLDYGIKADDIFISGSDIDLRCCCMTYIQLSLMGASAVINHADTLTMKKFDTFYTPCYFINYKLRNELEKSDEELDM